MFKIEFWKGIGHSLSWKVKTISIWKQNHEITLTVCAIVWQKKTMSLSTPHLGPKPNSVVREKCSRWFLLLYTITYTKGLSRITISSLGSCPLSSLWFKTRTEFCKLAFEFIQYLLNCQKLLAFTLINIFLNSYSIIFYTWLFSYLITVLYILLFQHLCCPNVWYIRTNKRFFLNNNSNQ